MRPLGKCPGLVDARHPTNTLRRRHRSLPTTQFHATHTACKPELGRGTPRAGCARNPLQTKSGVIRKMMLSTVITHARSRREDLSSTFCLVNPLCPVWVRPPPLSRRIDPPLQPSVAALIPISIGNKFVTSISPTIVRGSLSVSVKKPTNSPKSRCSGEASQQPENRQGETAAA